MGPRRWLPVAGVAAALVAASFAARSATVPLGRRDTAGEDLPPPTPSTPPTAEALRTAAPDEVPQGTAHDPGAIPPVFLWLGGALVLAIMVIIVLLALRTLTRTAISVRRGRLVVDEAAEQRERQRHEVAAAVAAGIAALDDADTDPRRAVIACWLRLERAAAAAGTERVASDTPADLVYRLLHTQQVSAAVLEIFAELYRRARYAPHDVPPDMREQARTALHRLSAELHQSAESGVRA